MSGSQKFIIEQACEVANRAFSFGAAAGKSRGDGIAIGLTVLTHAYCMAIARAAAGSPASLAKGVAMAKQMLDANIPAYAEADPQHRGDVQ